MIFLFLLMTCCFSLYGQKRFKQKDHPYKHAVGIRVMPLVNRIGYLNDGTHAWIWSSYKRFLSRKTALEFNAGVGHYVFGKRMGEYPDIYVVYERKRNPISIGINYSINLPIIPNGMKWVFGFGLAGVNHRSYYETTFDENGRKTGGRRVYENKPSAGTGIIGGLDYKFKKIPVNIAIDHRLFGFYAFKGLDEGGFIDYNFGITTRYAF